MRSIRKNVQIARELKMPRDERINVGSLKLYPAEAEKFKSAIDHYGYESTALFLRRAALGLIKHHKQGDTLAAPLALKTTDPPKVGESSI